MLDLIKQVLGGNRKDHASARASRPLLAACAILLEAAHADYEYTEEEREHLLHTMTAHFGLSSEEAHELEELAHQERSQAVDLFHFTNQVNSDFGHEDKLAVMEAVWRVFMADGTVDKHEEHLARKLTFLLRLSQRDMVEAKQKARAQT
jgi:uncharacterized tellurite resistance protein B-like protein